MTQHLVRTLAAMLRTLRAEADACSDVILRTAMLEAIVKLADALALAQRRDGR